MQQTSEKRTKITIEKKIEEILTKHGWPTADFFAHRTNSNEKLYCGPQNLFLPTFL